MKTHLAGSFKIHKQMLATSILISTILFELTLLTSIISAASPVRESKAAKMRQKLAQEKVVPDVIGAVPSSDVTIKYNSGVEVTYGNELTPRQVKDKPTVDWPTKQELYTVAMVDLDAPSRKDPSSREVLHWLVVNIPGKDISKGETLAEYIGAGPPKGTDLHRYVFIVYHQVNHHIIHSTLKVTNTSSIGRSKYSIKKFAQQHHLHVLAGKFRFIKQKKIIYQF